MGLAEPPDQEYPLVLTVGRYLGHWHTMTRTRQVTRLRTMHPEPVLEIHPDDAKEVGLTDGSLARIHSKRGMVTAVASLQETIRPGTVFLPMHWGASQANPCEANLLMHEKSCPRSGQPELKASAVYVIPAHATPKEAAPAITSCQPAESMTCGLQQTTPPSPVQG